MTIDIHIWIFPKETNAPPTQIGLLLRANRAVLAQQTGLFSKEENAPRTQRAFLAEAPFIAIVAGTIYCHKAQMRREQKGLSWRHTQGSSDK